MLSFASLPTELKVPNDAYAWRHIAFIVAPIYLLLIVAFLLAAYTTYPWLALLTLPFIGAQVYKITIIMHDCCHGTMFQSRRLNNIVGAIGGYFIATDFDAFRRTHWKHHSTFGEPEDPQGDDYLDLETTPRGRLIWHLVRPLIGYNLFKLLMYGQVRGKETSEVRKSQVSLLLGIGVVHISLALSATGFGTVWWTVALYPVAAATWALFFSQARGFAEHVAMPGQTPVQHARTHLPNWVDRMFFYDLNFNYHIEHHAYPSVPSCHLPRLHQRMQGDDELPKVSASIAGTIVQRVRAAPRH